MTVLTLQMESYDTDQYSAPEAVRVRITVYAKVGHFDNAEEDAQSANDDECDADNHRLDMAVRAHNGSSLVRLNDKHRLNRGSGHHGLLLRLHRAVLFLCYTDTNTQLCHVCWRITNCFDRTTPGKKMEKLSGRQVHQVQLEKDGRDGTIAGWRQI